LRKQDSTVCNLLEAIGAFTRIEIRVERLIGVVLRSIVLVAHSQVEREPGLNLPRIVEVAVPLVIAIAPAEIRLSQWRGQSAVRRDNSCASVRIVLAREFSLGESR